MSRLDELIQQLCPDGVEYRQLGEIATYATGRIVAQSVNADTYVGVDNLLPDKKGKTTSEYVPVNGKLVEFLEGDILIGNIRPYLKKIWRATCSGGTNGDVLAIRPNSQNEICSEFLYYILSSDAFFLYDMQNAKGAKMPRGDKAAVLRYKLPVPPMQVQQETVRILDQFTKLTAELTAELTARKKQYEYYRDVLLSINSEQWTTLGNRQLFNFHYGKGNTIPKSDGANPVYGCNGIVGTINTYNCQDVPIVGHIGSAGIVNWGAGKIFVTYNGTICDVIDRNLISTKFLFYFLQSANLPQYVKGSQPFLSVSDFEQVKFPLISIQEQRRIASILDRFDTLCNDLTSGLPAEIEARRKQYEYYRDKLLTFPHKNKKEPHNG